MCAFAKRFVSEERGVVLIETLLAVPVLTLLAFSILEFGNMMWQREQLQTGVKDAARYWARCRPTGAGGSTFMSCDIATARRIAFTGLPSGGVVRVPGWDAASELTITPLTPPGTPSSTDLVTVQGTVTYQGSPWFNALISNNIQLGYYHQTRYLGW